MSTSFSDRIDALFQRLEDAIDDSGLDSDFVNEGSVFTVTVEGCHPIILNRHAPTQQMWLATKAGGYHLEYDEAKADWICTRTGEAFNALWLEACEGQFGQAINY